jgi:hypothetical protein
MKIVFVKKLRAHCTHGGPATIQFRIFVPVVSKNIKIKIEL